MTSLEEQHARRLAGAHNQAALEAIARHLHYNESIHLHDLSDEAAKVCNYCWLRAGKAIWALREAKLPVVLGPDPVHADEPVEVEAEVLHSLEIAGARRSGEEVQGWTVAHMDPERTDWSKRLLVFRDQDRRHYGATFAEFMHAEPAARIVCHPVARTPVVKQTARYELAETAATHG